MTPSKSPAFEALGQEKARQSEKPQSELDVALEDTFPASDPVSATTTSTPTGTVPSSSSGADKRSDAPLVDQALASMRELEETDEVPILSAQEELAALKVEVARLRVSASEIGSATVRVAKAQTSEVIEGIEKRIRAEPFPAVGIAALIGFIWGIMR